MGEQMPPTYAPRPQDPLAAAWALERLGEKAVPALVAAIEDEDYPGWHLAVQTLGDIGPAAKPAVPLLAKAIGKRDREETAHIVRAKWRIDGDSAFALRELIPLLETPAGRQCNGAVRVLAHMGADAKEAVAALIAAMQKHADDEGASNLAWALGELAPHAKDEAVPALFAALENHRMADESARALTSLQIPAEQIVPPLVRALERSVDHDTAPASFALALEGFGPAAKAAVPSLVRALKHSNTVVRGVAARTLGRIGSDAKAAIPALTAALDDPYAAEEAQRAVERIRGTK
jgi:HEAT repeat protein